MSYIYILSYIFIMSTYILVWERRVIVQRNTYNLNVVFFLRTLIIFIKIQYFLCVASVMYVCGVW